jgi:catechol 2,3-dioxygenase-like lactoylglutathione lyase family enzyme
MAIEGMNHFTVLTDDLDATSRFYCGILGLTPGDRPDLGFPGMWLYCGGLPVLHVIAGRALPQDPRGVLDHMAFTATDLSGVTSALRANGIPFDLRRQAGAGTWQLFCFDPSGARVELDFDASEAAPTL